MYFNCFKSVTRFLYCAGCHWPRKKKRILQAEIYVIPRKLLSKIYIKTALNFNFFS